MTETDLSAWWTVDETAGQMGCSKRTVERLARAKKLEQRFRPQAGSPPLAVYNPDDVARIAAERHPAPPPFVLPRVQTLTQGNGHSRPPSGSIEALARLPADDDPIRQLFAAALRAVLSPPSPPVSETVAERLFLTLAEAAAISGLPQADLRRLIDEGDLNCRRTGRGGIRIRRKDLEAL